MIERVISGGQNGADVAGLRAAKIAGIPTGGVMPKGFKTLDGPRPQYAELYGATEHSSPLYPPRTFQNVRDSDGTMRFAADFQSAGERCTLKAISQYKKPYFDVDLNNPGKDTFVNAIPWLRENKIKVLNVAGNSEKTHPGTEQKVMTYFAILFDKVRLIEEMYESLSEDIGKKGDELDRKIDEYLDGEWTFTNRS